MFEIVYFLIFWAVACVFILFKNIKTGEIQLEGKLIQKIADSTSTYIKGIPAVLAALFVLIMRSSDSLFFLILIGAFLFCFAGDIGMEKGILTGLPLFLIAQLLFCFSFLSHALTTGLSDNVLILIAFVIIVVILYIFIFLRYLGSSETGLGKYRIPVVVYCFVISSMLVSSFLFWYTIEKIEAVIIVLGAISFVISDSIIGIHEFHHKISGKVLKVMTTYYLALFLLSLIVLIV